MSRRRGNNNEFRFSRYRLNQLVFGFTKGLFVFVFFIILSILLNCCFRNSGNVVTMTIEIDKDEKFPKENQQKPFVLDFCHSGKPSYSKDEYFSERLHNDQHTHAPPPHEHTYK